MLPGDGSRRSNSRRGVMPALCAPGDQVPLRQPSPLASLVFWQELWFCGPASQRVCPSTYAVEWKLLRSRHENKMYNTMLRRGRT